MLLMLVKRAYKTELDLNDEQVSVCKQHAGAARWAYNWGLAPAQQKLTCEQPGGGYLRWSGFNGSADPHPKL